MSEDKYIVYMMRKNNSGVQVQRFSCNDGIYWTVDKRDTRIDTFTLEEAKYVKEYSKEPMHYEKYDPDIYEMR